MTNATTLRLLFAAAVLLAIDLGAGRARADGGPTMESAAGEALAVLAATPAVAVGLVTHVGIAAHLASGDGSVPRSWAVTGTVVWSVGTVCSAVIVAITHSEYGGDSTGKYYHDDVPAAFAVSYGLLAVNAASLAFSIYGLTRPPHPPSQAPARGALSLAPPVIAPSGSGASLVLRGTF